MIRPTHLLPVALLAMSLVGGCNVLGVAAYKALPPPRIPAAYELPQAPTAVLVTADESIAGGQGQLDAETLAIALERSLEGIAQVPVVAEASAVQRVEVALDPPTSSLTLASDIEHGQVGAHVRVLSADGEEVWPADGSAGHYVEVQTPRVRSADPAELRRATLHLLGRQVAALFVSREMRADE